MSTGSVLIKFTEDDDFRNKIRQQLNSLPSLAARFYPLCEDRGDWMFIPSKTIEIDAEDGLPVPPPELWAGYCDNPIDYVQSGRSHFDSMLSILMKTGFRITDPESKVLDLGCAAGRMIRCFRRYAETLEVWGTDISSKPDVGTLL
jgi:2-polyprenyl-3-methyl-5-hydroxy-6-metoxy-1,4-benzoquinol methylase